MIILQNEKINAEFPKKKKCFYGKVYLPKNWHVKDDVHIVDYEHVWREWKILEIFSS